MPSAYTQVSGQWPALAQVCRVPESLQVKVKGWESLRPVVAGLHDSGLIREDC